MANGETYECANGHVYSDPKMAFQPCPQCRAKKEQAAEQADTEQQDR